MEWLSFFFTRSIADEWDTWRTWQHNQPASHYQISPIYDYYYTQQPLLRVTPSVPSPAYSYCFGSFTKLLVISLPFTPYIELLIDLYDRCKGYGRFLRGDNEVLTLLRQVAKSRDLSLVVNFNYSKYLYDYKYLHAHTVAQFSLSTLLMRIFLHYLSRIDSRYNFPCINIDHCLQAMRSRTFS